MHFDFNPGVDGQMAGHIAESTARSSSPLSIHGVGSVKPQTYGGQFPTSGFLFLRSAKVLLLTFSLAVTPASMWSAAHYQILRSFGTIANDGQTPRQQGLIVGSDGTLYGTTAAGGISNAGTIFSLNPDGSAYRVIYSFPTGNGGLTTPGLLAGSDGALYGTVPYDGSNRWGTVFKINKDGSDYALLHTFDGTRDGGGPNGLMEGSDGALYGTANAVSSNGYGAVFRLKRDGSEYQVLHSFSNTDNDGAWPEAGVIEGSDGALYGTTHQGGIANLGIVFRVSKDGREYAVLHGFNPSTTNLDGATPLGLMMAGADGVLYGTTYAGGGLGRGSVFKLNPDGTSYLQLQSFAVIYNHLIGQFPHSGLVEGADGALYGTTLYGGTNGLGTIFRISKDGAETETLHQFHTTLNGDGEYPWAGLAKGPDGAFYGTTAEGGALGVGTVFRLLPPQTPDLLAVWFAGGTSEVSFAGVGSYKYQVLRSTNLVDWAVLNTITMPLAGVYTNVDNSPPTLAAYYRVAWSP